MPCYKPKIDIGKDFIHSMTTKMECKSFFNGNKEMKCRCCDEFKAPLDSIKEFFIVMVEDFYSDNVDLEDMTTDVFNNVASERLASYLKSNLIPLNLHSPRYQFIVFDANNEYPIELCLSTTIRLFGLNGYCCRNVKTIHTGNRKEHALSFLQFLSQNFEKTRSMSNYYKRFRERFPQSLTIVSKGNCQARAIVKKLGGAIVDFTEEQRQSLHYILRNHLSDPGERVTIDHGGENIEFGPPAGIAPWDGLNERIETRPLHNAIVDAMSHVWSASSAAREYLRYKINVLLSKIKESNPIGYPQQSHTDLDRGHIETTKDCMGIKPMIAFCPLHKDGCILAIWVPDFKAYQPKRKDKKTGFYFMYIPFGRMLILPGDTFHAGGFCFGGSTQQEGVPLDQAGYTNHRLHFFICPNDLIYDEIELGHVTVMEKSNEQKSYHKYGTDKGNDTGDDDEGVDKDGIVDADNDGVGNNDDDDNDKDDDNDDDDDDDEDVDEDVDEDDDTNDDDSTYVDKDEVVDVVKLAGRKRRKPRKAAVKKTRSRPIVNRRDRLYEDPHYRIDEDHFLKLSQGLLAEWQPPQDSDDTSDGNDDSDEDDRKMPAKPTKKRG